ncbi:hypothetical protein LPB03_07330 [Polaribacter vadi]|uniref:Uncharacterized protein n=1 Tax=Polaribacter vadi TaxID=1774273 RepID=A0A1B8TYR3_9FLAO|nr:hypothetical protein [Polaribacter vadi]AOW17285.1 hypothetical protein LPB03_07330 [Polaribacter vadi]OBY64788.1 hypothetical protein LPB3_05160 [Polaribacter vadi]
MEAQKTVKTLTEQKLFVFPDTILIRINVLSSKKFNQNLFEEMGLLNSEQITAEINKLDNIKIIHRKNSDKNELIDFKYIEVYERNTYTELKSKILNKSPSVIEKIVINNFHNYKIEVEKNAIEESKKELISTLNKKGLELVGFHKITEIEQKKNIKINYDSISSPLDFKSVLKQTFNEYNYKGYLLNEKGEIILKKKFEVEWFIKQKK